MRAELTISHRQGDIAKLLESLYSASDSNALDASALAQKAPEAAESIVYAARTRGWIVMAESMGQERSVLYIESSGGGRLREGAVEIWREVDEGESAKTFKPKLRRLVLLDEDAGEKIATATTGIGASLKRGELLAPILTGLVTAAVIGGVAVLGQLTVAFVYGSLTAIGVAIISLFRLFLQSRSKDLLWG